MNMHLTVVVRPVVAVGALLCPPVGVDVVCT